MMRSTNEQLVLLVGASNVVDNDNEKDKKNYTNITYLYKYIVQFILYVQCS